jgi:hypothetical protein
VRINEHLIRSVMLDTSVCWISTPETYSAANGTGFTKEILDCSGSLRLKELVLQGNPPRGKYQDKDSCKVGLHLFYCCHQSRYAYILIKTWLLCFVTKCFVGDETTSTGLENRKYGGRDPSR